MEITHVCPRYHPHIGGVETYVRELATRQAKMGHQVEVYTTDPEGKLKSEEEIEGVVVQRFPSYAPGQAYYLSGKLQRFLKKGEYDVLHAHSYHALPGPRALKYVPARIKVFNTYFHGRGHTPFRNLLFAPYGLWARGAIKKSSTIIALSKHEMGLLEKRFPIKGKRKFIIPPGLDAGEISKALKKKRRPAEETVTVVLAVGRLEKYKGIGNLLDAIKKLESHRLVVVGKGPYENKLRSHASRIGVEDRVVWLGSIERNELLEQYRSASVVASLSPFESYGITISEALALGTPCVVAREGALGEFEDGIRCRGIDWPVEVDELVEAISVPFKQKKEKLDMWSWDDAAKKMEEAYE